MAAGKEESIWVKIAPVTGVLSVTGSIIMMFLTLKLEHISQSAIAKHNEEPHPHVAGLAPLSNELKSQKELISELVASQKVSMARMDGFIDLQKEMQRYNKEKQSELKETLSLIRVDIRNVNPD